MNGILNANNNSFITWVYNIFSKLNNAFVKVGYTRAATELERLGYHQEARQLINQLNEEI